MTILLEGAIDAEAYVGGIKKVIPIYHATKSRKLKGDVDSQLAHANMEQEVLSKARKRKGTQLGGILATYVYTTQAEETFFVELHQFDQKA